MLLLRNHFYHVNSNVWIFLALHRIQAISSGNQKEVARYHKTTEKSQKRWEKCSLVTRTYWTVIELLFACWSPPVWLNQKWRHLEWVNRSSVSTKAEKQNCQSHLINQRNYILSWLRLQKTLHVVWSSYFPRCRTCSVFDNTNTASSSLSPPPPCHPSSFT